MPKKFIFAATNLAPRGLYVEDEQENRPSAVLKASRRLNFCPAYYFVATAQMTLNNVFCVLGEFSVYAQRGPFESDP